MQKITIPEGTDLNKIIHLLNQSKKVTTSNQSDLHFEEWIFAALPEPLPKLMKQLESSSKKDTALLTILTILSAIIKNYKVDYDGKMEDCQLYTYILGDPAQGKGSVAKYRSVGLPFHLEQVNTFLNEYAAYEAYLAEWELDGKKGEKPVKPQRRFLFLSGNSSKASLVKDLKANQGYGLMFETEADTVYAANKSDFGGFSDILRKGFHSENLSVNRAGFEDGAIEIEKVILSVLLTSTLDQCFNFMPTYDNGLLSRFIFYILPQDLKFKQVFKKTNTGITESLITELGNLFRSLGYENLKLRETVFNLTENQEERFTSFFRFINDACVQNSHLHLIGSIHRLGLIFTRLCMLLSYFRNYSQPNQNAINILCKDIDFEITLSIVKKLINHLLLLDDLYNSKNPKQQNSFLIHSNTKSKRYSNETKMAAIKLKETGMSYSEVAQNILNDPSLKGTIQKWYTGKRPFPVSETETGPDKTIEVNSALKRAKVSFYDNIKANKHSEVFTLFDLLTTDKFKERVEEIRRAKPDEKKKLKAAMPAFTASGYFNPKRQKESLLKHSGFICIDIDAQDNLQIANFVTLKQELKNIINVTYLGKSVSGNGYFVLIPLEEPSLHEDYFKAIQAAFDHLGIVIDKSCKDVARLRIVSYDKAYHKPSNATVLNRVLEQEVKKQAFEFVEHDRFSGLLSEIKLKQIDITQSYQDWFAIGCSIANTFGEEGRDFFHTISQFHNGYKEKETNDQYSACIKKPRENGFTLGTIFYLADRYGITNYY